MSDIQSNESVKLANLNSKLFSNSMNECVQFSRFICNTLPATSIKQRRELYRTVTISIHLKNCSFAYSTNNMRAHRFWNVANNQMCVCVCSIQIKSMCKRERTKTTMRRKEIERMEQQMKREKEREKKWKFKKDCPFITYSSHYTVAKTYPPLSSSTNKTRTHFVSRMKTNIEAKLPSINWKWF